MRFAIIDIKISIFLRVLWIILRVWVFFFEEKKEIRKENRIEKVLDCNVRYCDLLKEFKLGGDVIRFEF